MLGDEMGERLVSATFESGKRLTAAAIRKFAKALQKRLHEGMDKLTPQKEKITQLDKHGDQLAGMAVGKDETRGLDRMMKKYDLDYSLIRAKNDPSKYTFFFKAKDIDRMSAAMEDLVNDKTLNNDNLTERLEKAREAALKINGVKKLEKRQEKTKSKGKAKEVSR